ncbi:MAG: hypothetical protein IJ362_07700 [Oscillospiraceae bacterium]|nr:hypothetical protein [Oscillospiraceae bacterium]
MKFDITKLFLIATAMAAISYIMWQRGLMVISAKRAVAFIGHRRKNSWGASVTACTGYTKRTLRLENGKKYRLTFDCTLTGGEIKVMLSQGKTPLLAFDKDRTKHNLTAGGSLYTITTAFESASGDYKLQWEEI